MTRGWAHLQRPCQRAAVDPYLATGVVDFDRELAWLGGRGRRTSRLVVVGRCSIFDLEAGGSCPHRPQMLGVAIDEADRRTPHLPYPERPER